MHRVDNSTAVTSLPTFQPVGTQGYFTSGNPQTGAEPTIVDQDELADHGGELNR